MSLVGRTWRDDRINSLVVFGKDAASVPRTKQEGQALLAILELETATVWRVVELLHNGKPEYAARDLPEEAQTELAQAKHWLAVLRALYGGTN